MLAELAELAAACAAMGVRVPGGPEGVDALAGLLDNPWQPAEVPYAAGIQVVGTSGPAAEALAVAEPGGPGAAHVRAGRRRH